MYSQLLVDRLDGLGKVVDKMQPKVWEAVDKGSVSVRKALDPSLDPSMTALLRRSLPSESLSLSEDL